jgi:aryl-alcohol dehydrogenase-like predicted oxidoreductase
MEHRTLGKTGLSVSALGFGAAPIGFLETDQQRVGQILNLLLDSGVSLIDTAATYPGSEEAIGKAVSHRRSEYVLVSKCGQGSADLPGEPWSPKLIEASVDRALKRLNTDHLDVMLLHSCTRTVLDKGDALKALLKAQQAGKIRFAGYSGDNDAVAHAGELRGVAVVEASVNIVDQANIGVLARITQEQGAGVIAKRPVANAAWKRLEDQPGMYQSYARDYHERFKAMGLSLDDFDVADWGELALRFTLSVPSVNAAIIGTTNPDNARMNIIAADKGPLPAESVGKIRAAFDQAGGEDWPGLQ